MNPLTAGLALFNSVAGYFSRKQEIKAAKVIRKDELTKLDHTQNLEMIAAGRMSDIKQDDSARSSAGWMDDISFYFGLSVCALCFYPPAVPHILKGFKALESMPEPFQWFMAMMMASVWGYKRVLAPIFEAVAKAYVKKF